MGTNVVLISKNLTHLEQALHEAKTSGIPHALVVDSGHVLPPHFDGLLIPTCLGLGPASRDKIKHITKKFKSL